MPMKIDQNDSGRAYFFLRSIEIVSNSFLYQHSSNTFYAAYNDNRGRSTRNDARHESENYFEKWRQPSNDYVKR